MFHAKACPHPSSRCCEGEGDRTSQKEASWSSFVLVWLHPLLYLISIGPPLFSASLLGLQLGEAHGEAGALWVVSGSNSQTRPLGELGADRGSWAYLEAPR